MGRKKKGKSVILRRGKSVAEVTHHNEDLAENNGADFRGELAFVARLKQAPEAPQCPNCDATATTRA